MNLEQRTHALLALVDDYRRRRHDELVGPAQAQARALLKAARGEARQRVHTAVVEARERLATEVAAAQAGLQTERRLAAQRRELAELAAAWSQLRPALLERWRQPASRASWVAYHLENARAMLPAGAWEIEHAPDWPQPECEQATARLRAAGIELARCAANPSITAGLRIRAGRNVLDATLEGLLEDRTALEGRLLRALAETVEPVR